MLSIEDYIARRKEEDNLNIFDTEKQIENIKIIVNYVFEYFNNYLSMSENEEKTILHREQVDKYRNQLQDYDPEVREWIVNIYDEYGNQMNRIVGNILKNYDFFYLYSSDSDFRSLSYDCYSKLIKKLPYLKEQTEMLFLFIKEYHAVQSQRRMSCDNPFISKSINEWVNDTWKKYRVNLFAFTFDWVDYFYNTEKLWPVSYRIKSQETWRKYVYDIKQKSNLFNLDSLYRKMPKKSFVKGRKQEFEVIMMYYWLNSIEGDDDGYWEEYLAKVLPSID